MTFQGFPGPDQLSAFPFILSPVDKQPIHLHGCHWTTWLSEEADAAGLALIPELQPVDGNAMMIDVCCIISSRLCNVFNYSLNSIP